MCPNFGTSKHNYITFETNGKFIAFKTKVKVSHSLIAVGAVGVRVPLYLGHS